MSIVAKARAKRVTLCMGALLAATGLSGCTLTIPPISEVEQETVQQTVSDDQLVTAGTLTVALNTNDAPQAMEQNDTVVGYAADTARALAKHMGLKVQFVNAGVPAEPLSSKKADIFIGSDEGSKATGVTLSGVYLTNATALFGKADVASSVTADTLSGATIGVQSSSSSQDVLTRSGISVTQQTYSSINECFAALASGEVQYVACDAVAGGYVSRAYSDVSFIATLSKTTDKVIAFSSSSDTLKTAVTKALDEISSDGTLDAVRTKWFGNIPSDLSSKVLSGITVSSSSSSTSSDSSDSSSSSSSSSSSTSADSSTSSGTTTITDEDINSLSSN